jgi:hypothetical protein
MLQIIISPAYVNGKRIHGRFVATLAGRQLCRSREPLLAASRILLTEGVDPETPIAARHAGADFDTLMSTVGATAGLAVSEGNTRSATLVAYKAFSPADVEVRVRFDERPALDTGHGVERISGGEGVMLIATSIPPAVTTLRNARGCHAALLRAERLPRTSPKYRRAEQLARRYVESKEAASRNAGESDVDD